MVPVVNDEVATRLLELFSQTATETAAVADEVVVRASFLRDLDQAAAVADDVTVRAAFSRVAEQPAGVVDTVAPRAAYGRAFDQVPAVVDDVSALASFSRSFDQAVAVVDNVATVASFSRPVTETAAVADAVSVTFIRGLITQSVSQPVSVVDAVKATFLGQMIDSFEDEDISEYTGDTGSFAVTDNQQFHGDVALESTDTASQFVDIHSQPGDGLDNYPAKGEEFHFYFRYNTFHTGGRFAQPSFYRDATGAGVNRIGFRFEGNDDELQVVRLGGDVTSAVIARGSPLSDATVDKWWRMEVIWDDAEGSLTGTPHELSATIVDPTDDSTVLSASTTEDNSVINNQRGIGWATERFDTAGESMWYDFAHIVRSTVLDLRRAEAVGVVDEVAATLISARTFVDDFEDQDLAEYNISGPGSIYAIDTGNPIEGDASVLRTDESGGYETLISDSTASDPLPNYPTKGDVFQMKYRSQSVGTNYVQSSLVFGAADTGNLYEARYEWEEDRITLINRSGGGNTNLATDGTASGGAISGGDVIVIEVTWDDGTLGGSDNEITATLYNSDKTTEYTSISDTNSDHASEEGVGLKTYVSVSGANLTGDSIEIL